MSLAASAMLIARKQAAAWGRRRPDLREEFESGAMLALVEAERTYRPAMGHEFTTHAWHRVAWAIRDVLRRHRPGGIRFADPNLASVAMYPSLASREPDPAAVAEAADAAEAILAMLPPKAAEAARLVALDGLTYAEAAGRMGCCQSEVARLMRKCFRILDAEGIRC